MSASVDLTGLVLPSTVEEQSRSADDRRAEYVVQPLERGFGHTVGNSIRRVLLSSLPGAAIWAFRGDGIQHEHQTIAGVVEDVHQIIQNLKALVLILDPEVDEARLELSVYKAGIVRASHIAKHSAARIVNPEQMLFTLQEDLPENRPLNMSFWVKRGRGFVMADQHEKPEGAPVDLIRVDSIFNPVVRANFVVQETRVGQRTDFDRLSVEVETNGSMDPADAIAYAAEVAQMHLGYLTQLGRTTGGVRRGDGTAAPPGRRPVSPDLAELLERSLEEFDAISVRSRNTLDKADIRTLGDVAAMTRDEMLEVANFGEKSLEEVAEVLALNGLKFGMRLERDEEGRLFILEESTGNGAGSSDAA
ncbi:MAG: DNA-directed RNA polymerase subunit alpha [Gemmatimonadota bacterium]